jgi:preprotein translocase subunit SecG
MYQVIIAIHVLLALGIIGLVMIQQGKGADAGASFGSGSAGSVFGAQGAASFLSRTTAILATGFFITSLGLAIINGHKGAAYDIISNPEAGDKPSIPGVTDTSSNADIVTPPAMPKIAPDAIPAAPAIQTTPSVETQPAPAKEAEIEKIVPKAEEIKAVEEKKIPEKAHTKSSKHSSKDKNHKNKDHK